MNKKFTQNWSSYLKWVLERFYPKDNDPMGEMKCCEIGSFEGRGSLMIVDYLCQHKDSILYCIDPWIDGVYVKDKDIFKGDDKYFTKQYDRFLYNTQEELKIVPLRGTSNDMIKEIEDDSLDFCFIDGDHSEFQVYMDAVLIFPKMKSMGVIVFDDFFWELNGEKCGDGINRFIREYIDELDILYWSSCVVVQVFKNSNL